MIKIFFPLYESSNHGSTHFCELQSTNGWVEISCWGDIRTRAKSRLNLD